MVSGPPALCKGGDYAAACAYASDLVGLYFQMLTVGCQSNSSCTNNWCASNSRFSPLTPGEAAVRSILLATQSPVPLCQSLQVKHLAPSSEVAVHSKREEQPETVEHDEEPNNKSASVPHEQADARPCTPRRRISTAMEIDQELHSADNNIQHEPGVRVKFPQPEERDTDKPRRRMSHTKQRLLDAIKGSFSRCGAKKLRSQPKA